MMEHILKAIRSLDDVVELAPEASSEFPEIAWGDHFFYYSPDGTVPANTQPFATIVTKDYPDDTSSNLDPDGRWRLNIHVGSDKFSELIGESSKTFTPRDFSEADVFLPHPVYGSLGWVAVVTPGSATLDTVIGVLRRAHSDARLRIERRSGD